MMRLVIIYLFIIACDNNVECKKLREENSASQPSADAPVERTLMISNLVLLPVLAGVGVKFLLLLPIILSKIALLGILSFVSSNLSLLVSAVIGVRSYFFDDHPHDDDHHSTADKYDPFDKYMNRYKSYGFSHPEYDPEYKYHDDRKHSKKLFRPFKLLSRIKDVIKNHFHKSREHGEKYHRYENDHKYDPHDFSADDHNGYSYELRDAKYRNSDYLTDSNGKYYEVYRVQQDWSNKDHLANNDALKGEKYQDYTTSIPSGSDNGQLRILLINNAGEPAHGNLNLTHS